MVVKLENIEKSTDKNSDCWDNYAKNKFDGDVNWGITGTPELFGFRDRVQKKFYSKIININQGQRALDAGCAFGRWTFFFTEKDLFCIGIDSSRDMASMARIENQRQNFNAEFLIGDTTYLPFKDNSFDLVNCFGLLIYITEQQRFSHIVSELVRVCKVGGVLTICEIAGRKTRTACDSSVPTTIILRSINEITNEFQKNACILNHIYSIEFLIPTYLLKIISKCIKRLPKCFIRSAVEVDYLISKLPILNRFGSRKLFILKKV